MRTVQTPKSLQTKKVLLVHVYCESSLHSVLSRQFRSKLGAKKKDWVKYPSPRNIQDPENCWVKQPSFKFCRISTWVPFLHQQSAHLDLLFDVLLLIALSWVSQAKGSSNTDPPKKLAIITIITRKISIDIWCAQKKGGKLLAAANSGKLQKTSAGESQFCNRKLSQILNFARLGSSQLGIHGLQFLIDAVHGLHLRGFWEKKTVGKSSVKETRRWLAGWWFQPLWKIWKSVGVTIPSMWKNKKCSKPPTRRWLGMKATMLLWFYGDFMGYQRILNGYEWM